MAVTTIPSKQVKVQFRVTSPTGICVDGVDYGPYHVDAPVHIPLADARRLVRNGRGHIVAGGQAVEQAMQSPGPRRGGRRRAAE